MSISATPKVSIVIPVYNGSNYLENAINCALGQTYENLEVIVVNDGSTDEGKTREIALKYSDKIRYFEKANGGVSSALNLGIREMNGEYFSWLSHDDAYTADKILDAISALRENNALDGRTIAYSDGNYIDKDAKVVKAFSSGLQTSRRYSGSEMVNHLVDFGTLNGCCMLMPKSVFDECGVFDETLRYSQDALMWYRMFLKGYGLVFDGKPNVMYRLHAAQTSNTRHELFEKDATYIANILAPQMRKISTKPNNLLYKYALRMAKYRCVKVVEIMQEHADGECRFTLGQKANLKLRLLYGKTRGFLKRIYYRFVLKVKV